MCSNVIEERAAKTQRKFCFGARSHNLIGSEFTENSRRVFGSMEGKTEQLLTEITCLQSFTVARRGYQKMARFLITSRELRA